MAARSLGRSIIECGRPNFSKGERKIRNSSARRWKLVDGEYEPGPRKGDGRSLSDDLAPLRRWLISRAGKEWDAVYAEFCAREDRRTLRGWHIHTHLRDYVSPDVERFGGGEFAIEDGILCHVPYSQRRYAVDPRIAEFAAWMDKRKFYPLEDGSFLWAKKGITKSWVTGRFVAFWLHGDSLTSKELGHVMTYPKRIWQQHLLSKWELEYRREAA